MRLVRHFATLAAYDVAALLLLHIVHLLYARLVHEDDVLLQPLQLLLQVVESVIQLLLFLLVSVELVVQENDLLLVAHLLSLIKGLLEHDAVSFVLQLAVLLIVND